MTIVRVCAIGGTWSWSGGWWSPRSGFWQAMAAHGIAPLLIEGEPFEWETGLGKSLMFWASDASRTSGWRYAGKSLRYYLDHVPDAERVVLAHSHAGQVVAHAAASGFKFARVLTVGTPSRADMRSTYASAREAIGHWSHVSSAEHDAVGWWGAFGDRRIGGDRRIPEAHTNIVIPGIGHSGLFHDLDQFHHWTAAGLIARLRGEEMTP